MSNYNWPINPTTVNSGPLQYELDGNPITVNIDSGTPANSTPLPVVQYGPTGIPFDPTKQQSAFILDAVETVVERDTATTANSKPFPVINLDNLGVPVDFATETTLASIDTKTPALVGGAVPVTGPLTDTQLRATPVPISATSLPLPTGAATEATLSAMSAKLPATLGQKAMAASMAVTIASDQSAVPVSQAAGSTGNSPGSSTVSTVATITAPANALGFILMNLDTSTTNIRYRIGGTAAVASGQQLQPGRDTGYIPCGANISIIAESGTCNYDIQWVIR